MEIVLGVSMTPTTVRMAVVEGERADGVILEKDVFDITALDGSVPSSASEQVIAAILGTVEGAVAAGHDLMSIGVSWSDHTEVAALRDALSTRGIDDVVLVPELHAAAALAQTVGRAVGYAKTAVLLMEHDCATLAVVDTPDGSITHVLNRSLHSPDAISVLTEMTAGLLDTETTTPQGMFVVGTSVDVAAVKSHLQDLLSMPVIAPEEPQLALARGAALASAKTPREDTSTTGMAYSQDPDGLLAFLSADDADTGGTDELRRGGKPFAVAGSALSAVFCVGVAALAVTMAVNIEPVVQQGTSDVTSHPAPPPARVHRAQPVAPPPPAPRRPAEPVIQLPIPGLAPIVIGPPRYVPGNPGRGHGGDRLTPPSTQAHRGTNADTPRSPRSAETPRRRATPAGRAHRAPRR